MKKKKKKVWLGISVSLIVGLLLGLALGVALRPILDRMGDITLPKMLLLYLLLAASYFLQLILHEGGHLVCGLLSGYRFQSFRVGSLMLFRDKEGRLSFRRYTLAGTGGQCLLSPPDWSEDFRCVLYNLGGVLMNLLSAAVFGGLYLLGRGHWTFLCFCLCTAGIGVIFALLNGVPMRTAMVDNDGKNVRSLRKNTQAKRAFWTQLAVNAALAEETRLRDMPESWFRLPADADLGNSLIATVAVQASSRLMDGLKWEEAEKAVNDLLEQEANIPGIYVPLLTCDRITCRLMQGDTEGAEALLTPALDKQLKQFKTQPSVLRTRILMADAAGNGEESAKYRAALEKLAKTYPYPADLRSEREILAAWEEKQK